MVYLVQVLLDIDLLFFDSVFVLHWTAYFGFSSKGYEPYPAMKIRWLSKNRFVFQIPPGENHYSVSPRIVWPMYDYKSHDSHRHEWSAWTNERLHEVLWAEPRLLRYIWKIIITYNYSWFCQGPVPGSAYFVEHSCPKSCPK